LTGSAGQTDRKKTYTAYVVRGTRDVQYKASAGATDYAGWTDPENLEEDGTRKSSAKSELDDVTLAGYTVAMAQVDAAGTVTGAAASEFAFAYLAQIQGLQDAAVGVEFVEGMAATYTPGMKAKTNWAAGASFDLGPAKLGFGLDSEKKMQMSVGGEFGDFSGSVFYAQQDAKTSGGEKKLTGMVTCSPVFRVCWSKQKHAIFEK